jgi:molybdate transport system substrate-binding protein
VRRALGLLAVLAAGCGGDDDEVRLVVSAASSMTEALNECAGDFPDATLRMQFAGSDELAGQIRQGVKPDVYAAANTSIPEELHADGLLEEPVMFATNELVLAVRANSEVSALADVTQDGVTIAIGSESVPVGEYTRKSLARLPPRQEKAILANVRSSEPDVKGIVGKLTQGAADAGFVYVTDVKATEGALKAIALPKRLEPRAIYGAGVVAGARRPQEAQAFLGSLTRGACARALRRAGFGPPP